MISGSGISCKIVSTKQNFGNISGENVLVPANLQMFSTTVGCHVKGQISMVLPTNKHFAETP
jgi:hypothetical protein